jgi:hypothetical protein
MLSKWLLVHSFLYKESFLYFKIKARLKFINLNYTFVLIIFNMFYYFFIFSLTAFFCFQRLFKNYLVSLWVFR